MGEDFQPFEASMCHGHCFDLTAYAYQGLELVGAVLSILGIVRPCCAYELQLKYDNRSAENMRSE